MMRTLARSSPRMRPALSGRAAIGGNSISRAGTASAAAALAATATAAAGLLLASSAASGVEGYVPSHPAPATSSNTRKRAAFVNRLHVGAGVPPMLHRGSVALCESSPKAEQEEQFFDPSSHHDHYERVHPPDRSQTESHAIFGPLLGEGRIERYNFYRRVHHPVDSAKLQPNHNSAVGAEPIEVAVGDVQLGNKVNGHEGIVHEGIISLIFDDAMGWGYEALLMSDADLDADMTKIVTANLNIDYRAPLMEDSRAAVRVYYVRSEGRKIYFQARLESHDGETLYAEATSLFVKLRKE